MKINRPLSKLYCNGEIRRQGGARILMYYVYTAVLCSGLTSNFARRSEFRKRSNVHSYILALILLVFPFFSHAEVHQHQPSPEAMASEVLAYVNQYRASRGLPALVMNEAANREARQHSLDMAKHQVSFGHTGFSQRMNHLYHHIPNAEGGAENVAYNYKTARIVVDGWIKSSGHRQNMVGRYDMTGIGIVQDSQGRLYYTQLFVRTNKHAHPQTRTASRSAPRVHFFLG